MPRSTSSCSPRSVAVDSSHDVVLSGPKAFSHSASPSSSVSSQIGIAFTKEKSSSPSATRAQRTLNTSLGSPNHSPESNKGLKPYPGTTINNSLYSGLLSQLSTSGKYLNNPMYHAVANGLLDKSTGSLFPGAGLVNTSPNRNIGNLGNLHNFYIIGTYVIFYCVLGHVRTTMHPTAVRAPLHPNLPLNPFFPSPNMHTSPLAALYPGFPSAPLPMLQGQFSRQNGRHGMDYFDSLSALRFPTSQSLRSGISRDSSKLYH